MLKNLNKSGEKFRADIVHKAIRKFQHAYSLTDETRYKESLRDALVFCTANDVYLGKRTTKTLRPQLPDINTADGKSRLLKCSYRVMHNLKTSTPKQYHAGGMPTGKPKARSYAIAIPAEFKKSAADTVAKRIEHSQALTHQQNNYSSGK
jgi:hypothetical protein